METKTKNKTKRTAAVAEVVVPEIEPTVTVEVSEEKRKPGRPKDPNKPVKEKSGKRGRPINSESNRQKREAELASKREAGMLKKGRPKVDPKILEARRATRAAEKAKLAADIAANIAKTAEAANAAIEQL